MTNHTNSNTSAEQKLTPIYVLSGFLGSGKTTLLMRLLDYLKENGLKMAVIMNELGEVNLDGQMVQSEVPMAEMLDGCICCSIRGDLGVAISGLMEQHAPDVIVIESTGAANPMETMDGVTEASMYGKVELRSVITVVDGPELLARRRTGKGRTYKLMLEQIRCGSMLVLNKRDKLAPDELVEAEQLLREINEHAPIAAVSRCEITDWSFLKEASYIGDSQRHDLLQRQNHGHESNDHNDHNDHNNHQVQHNHHHSHEHVMTLTHYWSGPVHSEAFEALLRQLPDNIYRAKGIVTFADTSSTSRFLFQYAYKESDFMRIEPQGTVHDVAIFIGEHFSKEWLLEQLQRLDA